MRQTITKIKGVTVNVEVIEVHQQDATGATIWYHAAIYVQRHSGAKKTLVRQSRLPGAAAALRKEIQRDGLAAFDRLSFLARIDAQRPMRSDGSNKRDPGRHNK